MVEAVRPGVNEFLCKPVSAKGLLDRFVSIMAKPRASVHVGDYCGPGATTLPIRVYSEMRLDVKPEINAICTIMIALVAAATVAASLAAKRNAVTRERNGLAAQV